MPILYINARCREILRILLDQQEYMTIDRLAKQLGISRRSAYYDLCKINVWLEQAGASKLEIERGHGLLLPSGSRECIQSLLAEQSGEEQYIFSPAERIKLIFLYIVNSPEPVFLEQLIDCCAVSRNTVFHDLKDVTESLKPYDLALAFHNRRGYQIVGDPIRARALFILYFKELLTLYRDGILQFFDRDAIGQYHAELHRIEQELGVEYVDGALLAIAALLPAIVRNPQTFDFPGLKRGEMLMTREFHAVQTHFPQLPEDEMLYLTLHLLGSRVNMMPHGLLENESSQEIADMVRALVTEFEKVACITFDDRKALEQALAVHLKTSLYRYRFGIQIGNLLCNDIKNEYPELFGITKIAARRLERMIELPIPDEELAYLAMHFGAFLKISEPQANRLRILIVCVNGISTGNLLKREVQKLLPYAEIVRVVAAVDLMNAQNICDLIISTVKVNSVLPVIVVHPVLTEFDRNTILTHRLVAPRNLTVKRDRLFQVVKKYVAPENYEHLLADLTACLQGADTCAVGDVKNDTGLTAMLDESRVAIFDTADCWQNSIRLAAQSLLVHGSIERKYLDTIISQIEYYGPYMFLTDNVILAHAKPEDGVNCLDVSLAVFRTPVVFTETRRAQLVIVLAAEDQEKHLKILQDILVLVSDPASVAALAGCASPSALLTRIAALLAQAGEG